VNPHTLGQERVRAGDVDGHGAGRRIYPHDRLHKFVVHALVDEVVAGLHELRRREAPLVAAPHEERVLGRRLDPAVDDHEAVVLAEPDAGDTSAGHGCAVQTVV